jgi:hypothetical protein
MDWIASVWSSSAVWEGVEYVAEATVIVGCLFEGLTDFELILKGHENEKRRKRAEKRAFLILIVGLALGLTALVRTNQLFTDTITNLYGQARDANIRATTASDKATKAQDRADKASKHEEDLEIQTKREIDARLALEKDVLWRGPRDVLIRASKGVLRKQVHRFAGQRFRMSVCTPEQPTGSEEYSEPETTQEALRLVLSEIGWHNDRWPANAPEFPPVTVLTVFACNQVPGIYTGFTANASESTRTAARALQEALNVVLNQKVGLGPFQTIAISRSRDPLHEDEIDIEVDPHPSVAGNPRRISP